jgi:chromosomal replication initiator protein
MNTWTVTPAISAIQEAVCGQFGVTMAELVSQRRDRRVVVPRMAAMWLCRRASYTFPSIACAFGGRHHTTVISDVRRVDEVLKTDRQLASGLEALIETIQAVAVRATRPPDAA